MKANHQSARSLLVAQLHIMQAGPGLATAALAGASRFVEWQHYPARDVHDKVSQSRFFYHAHSADERVEGEHGHFHVFVPGNGSTASFSHLVGISLDTFGMPMRIFSTNRWVTDETWIDSSGMESRLARFRVDARGRMAPVAAWITAFVRAYKGDIGDLLRKRDTVVAKRTRKASLDQVLEDRKLAVISEKQVSLVDYFQSAGINP
ncbi:MAG TPA: hypothetical protein VJ698_07450 [Noviherbaspirillum sp.]|uniref:DUF6969 family protein n=1 Tax=Noviherbaspirillum sp. TaxID=1926288 RepID=UPI002B46550B|nr:hypothetical protein [Noviherbaspirillum sp.]HJV85297.1 hypothetical protein [Noviherbaspirillum sp.]